MAVCPLAEGGASASSEVGASASHVSRFHHICSRPQTGQRVCVGTSGVLSRLAWSVSMPVKTDAPFCGHLIMSEAMTPHPLSVERREIIAQYITHNGQDFWHCV